MNSDALPTWETLSDKQRKMLTEKVLAISAVNPNKFHSSIIPQIKKNREDELTVAIFSCFGLDEAHALAAPALLNRGL